jgi:hypothetical protein
MNTWRHVAPILAFAPGAFILLSCAANTDSEGSPTDQVSVVQQAVHSILFPPKSCVFGAVAGTGLLNLNNYGNWCGEDVSGRDVLGVGNNAPISCWDAACRTHDYAFGRWQDGGISCHSVVTAQDMVSELVSPTGRDERRFNRAVWTSSRHRHP